MVVTYKSLKDIRVNPISNDMPLSPTQDIAITGASLGLTGQIFLGSPCAITSMTGVQELLDLRATRPEMVNMCGVIRTWLEFQLARLNAYDRLQAGVRVFEVDGHHDEPVSRCKDWV